MDFLAIFLYFKLINSQSRGAKKPNIFPTLCSYGGFKVKNQDLLERTSISVRIKASKIYKPFAYIPQFFLPDYLIF